MILLKTICLLSALVTASFGSLNCKVSPADLAWPSENEWAALNHSIEGVLIKTAPIASSCYLGNPFNSPEECTSVQKKWSYAAHHAAWPESIDYPIYTNNSCVPKGATGYAERKGCSIGGLPQYIVNATTTEHVSWAMKWASKRNIRIVVKGTGHDLNGRSTGAFALSIWTHNFKHIERRSAWQLPGRNETDDVVVCGSGNNWGSVYTAVHRMNRSVVGGEDATVGLGGLIQNGGHGFLSSHLGLASDQVYQVTVVTTDGRSLVANSVENGDLFWAVRGGGGGQYGVVTEFILKTHPVPANVVMGGFSFYAADSSNLSETASWNALSEVVSSIPNLMDGGLNGNITAYTKTRAMALGLKEAPRGVAAVLGFVGLNMTADGMDDIIDKLAARVTSIGNSSYLNISRQKTSSQSYWSFAKPEPLSSNSAGAVSLMTSRLMGRRELSDIPRNDLTEYLQQALVSENPEAGTMLLFGLQGGRGPARVPTYMRGSVLPAWRTAYAHVFTLGASINATGDASKSLNAAADWYEAVKEPVWRNWAPNTGSYMNEGNPFSSTWKKDFYGENYEMLLAIKRKFDPSESLFVWSGVGSDLWNYDLNSGLLCRVES
ncbi:hypothetical protein N7537_010046 [Penicillium hordei]|uniref:FAD-binding PCMH-type domain-containing protein n=1 Tax=Penicillium hordei TaxID=40994 RepID=A0AAD6DVG0_9EURO|nr:uncharacterized protein N7537_010046 [Penicillium hordei]KAJ5593142.1 hypothetical protein N7537_010046 [Penicillium hordei]